MLLIYGASDDLIEVEGEIQEEFYANDEGGYLAVSGGTFIRYYYDSDGIWSFRTLLVGENSVHHYPADEELEITGERSRRNQGDFSGIDVPSYSQVIGITSREPIRLVLHGSDLAKARA